MWEKKKVWVNLSAALLASTALAPGSMAAGSIEITDISKPKDVSAPMLFRQIATGESGESGEAGAEQPPLMEGGESGESGEAGDTGESGEAGESGESGEAGEGGEAGESGEGGEGADLGSSDTAYLTQLAMMRGHLDIGIDLYKSGAIDAAKPHMKHPEDELYSDLAEALEMRGVEGFADQLEELAHKVEEGASNDDVSSSYQDVLRGIGAAEAAAGAPSAQQIGKVILMLAKTAAEEYEMSVDAGRVIESHEYQDALGFVRIADGLASRLAQAEANQKAAAKIREQLAVMKPAWPSIMPKEQATLEASVLYGAVARIEIATLSLKE